MSFPCIIVLAKPCCCPRRIIITKMRSYYTVWFLNSLYWCYTASSLLIGRDTDGIRDYCSSLTLLRCYMLRLKKILLLRRELHHKFLQRKCFSPSLTKKLTRCNVAKKGNTRFSYVSYSMTKHGFIDQSDLAQRAIYIKNDFRTYEIKRLVLFFL